MDEREAMIAGAAAASVYDQLWLQTCSAMNGQGVEADFHLRDRAKDQRRGFTLIVRPNRDVQMTVAKFLMELDAVAPEQHFYRPTELHVSILSVFVCVVDWQSKAARLPGVQTRLAEVLRQQRVFELVFRGVTASPAAVMIQGFPLDQSLQSLRERVRQEFAAIGLVDEMDRRYPPVTAHLTVMRFRRQLAQREAFLRFLELNRQRDFGRSRVTSLQLVWNDWYMSDEEVRVVAEYPLS